MALSTYIRVRGRDRGVMLIVVGNELGDPSSNPGSGYLQFT